MGFLNRSNNCAEFFLLGHIHRVVFIHTGNGLIGRNFDDVHAVDITEFLFFRQRSTGHACFFLILIKEVLERDGCQGLALSSDFYMLFGFDRLVEAIGVTASRHDTSGEFVYDQHFIILDHIVLVTEHQVMGTQRQDNIMLDLQVFRICQVFYTKEFFYFVDALLRQVDDLIFFVDNEVSGFDDLLTHDGSHLGHFTACLTAFQLSRQNVADFIQLGGFSALSGNDQRRTRLIDQYGVHLIDDGIVKISLHQLFFINDHVVTKVIKAQLIIGHVSNVAGILSAALIVFHRV